MKKIAISLLLCLPILQISAQFQEDAFCNTPAPEYSEFISLPWFGNSSFIYNFLDEINFANYKMTYDNAKYYVPIKIWVYRTDEGTGGATATELQQLIRDLNTHNITNNTGFLYYLKPEIGYIDKTKFQRVNFTTEAPGLSLKNSDNGCINVHIVDDLFKKV
ncbi:MAG TPA: hypothetical protein DCQ31_11045, partial [Bacteroidales bacterium]|nr:hypothetical protein [Bacteroidales bacterium]